MMIQNGNVEVNGIVDKSRLEATGNITATSSVEMLSGSKIVGDVTTKELRIEDGVDFTGKVTMLEHDLNLDVFSYAASDFKNVLLSASDDNLE